MSKKVSKPSAAKTDDKPIAVVITIYPPKNDKRKVMVSAAPSGEMPIVLSGLFADRHALLDQAYGQLLKRDPQIVTPKAEKKAATRAANNKKKSVGAPGDEDDEPEAEDTDQSVTESEATEEPSSEDASLTAIISPADLPEIEGDSSDELESEDETTEEDNG